MNFNLWWLFETGLKCVQCSCEQYDVCYHVAFLTVLKILTGPLSNIYFIIHMHTYTMLLVSVSRCLVVTTTLMYVYIW